MAENEVLEVFPPRTRKKSKGRKKKHSTKVPSDEKLSEKSQKTAKTPEKAPHRKTNKSKQSSVSSSPTSIVPNHLDMKKFADLGIQTPQKVKKKQKKHVEEETEQSPESKAKAKKLSNLKKVVCEGKTTGGTEHTLPGSPSVPPEVPLNVTGMPVFMMNVKNVQEIIKENAKIINHPLLRSNFTKAESDEEVVAITMPEVDKHGDDHSSENDMKSEETISFKSASSVKTCDESSLDTLKRSIADSLEIEKKLLKERSLVRPNSRHSDIDEDNSHIFPATAIPSELAPLEHNVIVNTITASQYPHSSPELHVPSKIVSEVLDSQENFNLTSNANLHCSPKHFNLKVPELQEGDTIDDIVAKFNLAKGQLVAVLDLIKYNAEKKDDESTILIDAEANSSTNKNVSSVEIKNIYYDSKEEAHVVDEHKNEPVLVVNEVRNEPTLEVDKKIPEVFEDNTVPLIQFPSLENFKETREEEKANTPNCKIKDVESMTAIQNELKNTIFSERNYRDCVEQFKNHTDNNTETICSAEDEQDCIQYAKAYKRKKKEENDVSNHDSCLDLLEKLMIIKKDLYPVLSEIQQEISKDKSRPKSKEVLCCVSKANFIKATNAGKTIQTITKLSDMDLKLQDLDSVVNKLLGSCDAQVNEDGTQTSEDERIIISGDTLTHLLKMHDIMGNMIINLQNVSRCLGKGPAQENTKIFDQKEKDKSQSKTEFKRKKFGFQKNTEFAAVTKGLSEQKMRMLHSGCLCDHILEVPKLRRPDVPHSPTSKKRLLSEPKPHYFSEDRGFLGPKIQSHDRTKFSRLHNKHVEEILKIKEKIEISERCSFFGNKTKSLTKKPSKLSRLFRK